MSNNLADEAMLLLQAGNYDMALKALDKAHDSESDINLKALYEGEAIMLLALLEADRLK